jgi:hypothetical protein
MRFFSNDAKETNDDESSTVPQQRSGSPWSDAPGNSENSEYADGPAETATAVDDRDQVDLPLDEQGTYDEPAVNESTVTSPDAPVDEPTDAEVAGADNDPALRDEGDFDEPTAVDPVTDEPLDTTEDTTDEPTDTVDSTDTVVTDSSTTDEESDAVDEPADEFPETSDLGVVPADTTDTLNDADDSVDDSDERENEEVIENADVSDTLLDAEPVESDGESSTYASASAADDTVTSDDDTVAEDPTPADVPETAPVVAAVPVAAVSAEATPGDEPAKPGSVEEKSVESFFGADAAKGFQERWRDVQLRFVDSPKDATAEAAGLVDEAVDQLTASLKGQKDGLLSDSDDTEKLRVELRGYRDILNKVLSL